MRPRASISVGLVFYWFFDYNQSMSHRQAIIKLVQFLRENYPDVQYFNTPCLANDYQEEVYRDEEAGICAMFAPEWGYIDLYGVSTFEFASFIRNEHLIKDEKENENNIKEID